MDYCIAFNLPIDRMTRMSKHQTTIAALLTAHQHRWKILGGVIQGEVVYVNDNRVSWSEWEVLEHLTIRQVYYWLGY